VVNDREQTNRFAPQLQQGMAPLRIPHLRYFQRSNAVGAEMPNSSAQFAPGGDQRRLIEEAQLKGQTVRTEGLAEASRHKMRILCSDKMAWRIAARSIAFAGGACVGPTTR
jgi:hypothetical protein